MGTNKDPWDPRQKTRRRPVRLRNQAAGRPFSLNYIIRDRAKMKLEEALLYPSIFITDHRLQSKLLMMETPNNMLTKH